MPLATVSVLLDLAGDGGFATDVSRFVFLDDGIALGGLGREGGQDAAGTQRLSLKLTNRSGEFSHAPTSPYYPNFEPYKGIKVKVSWNSILYDEFTGTITKISIRPGISEQICHITAEDGFFALSKTDVYRPLMIDQYSGVIVDRLLDDSEEGEACTNTAFAKDLTGWTTFGGATQTRMTDNKVLEGPGSNRVVVAGANTGTQHTMTGKNGQKFTLVAYVKPERDADIGLTAQIRMNSNSGFVATSTAGTLLRDYWTRLEVSGTYQAGSTTQFIDVFAATAGTQFRIGAVHAPPFAGVIPRRVDRGQCPIEKFGALRDKASDLIEDIRRSEGLALFYFNEAGEACFEDRHHRWRDDHLTPQFTFSTDALPPDLIMPDYQEWGEDRIKEVNIDFPKWLDGVPGTEFWKLDREVYLPPGVLVPVKADYEGGILRNTIVPIANTDYTITGATGNDVTGSVTFTFLDFGKGSVGYFTYTGTAAAWLRTYQVRGTPVRDASDRSPARAVSTGPSLAAIMSFSVPYLASQPHVQSLAEYLCFRYDTQIERMEGTLYTTFPSPPTTSKMAAILGLGISDRITLRNTSVAGSTKVNADYYIDSIDREIMGGRISLKMRLAPVDEVYLGLDDANLGLDDAAVALSP